MLRAPVSASFCSRLARAEPPHEASGLHPSEFDMCASSLMTKARIGAPSQHTDRAWIAPRRELRNVLLRPPPEVARHS
eukprot:568385-Prymnesium_polylepis.1